MDICHNKLGQTAAGESHGVTPGLGPEDSDYVEIVVPDVLMDMGEGFFLGGTVAAFAFVHGNSLVGGYDSGIAGAVVRCGGLPNAQVRSGGTWTTRAQQRGIEVAVSVR